MSGVSGDRSAKPPVGLGRGLRLLVVAGSMALLAGCQPDGPAGRPVTQASPAMQNFQALLQSAQAGDAAAQARAGLAYYSAARTGADTQKATSAAQALRWLRAAAAQGNADGEYGLGMIYSNGVGIPANPAEAVKNYRLAANKGHAGGQTALGTAYLNGVGLSQDFAEARRLFTLAAEKKNSAAQNNLGLMAERGNGIAVDYAEAVRWYKLAADQGNAVSQSNLAGMYARGVGVPADNVLAYFWFNLASPKLTGTAQANAMKGRDAMAAKLSTAELQRAQAMARDWKPGQVDTVEAALLEAASAAPAEGTAAAGGTTGAAAAAHRRMLSSGSGFTISKAGHVLTNAHVVDSCGEIRARLPGEPATIVDLVARDTQNDLAVLKLARAPGAVAAFRADAAVRQGDSVVVYGFPLGETLASEGNLTTGSVSALSGIRNDSRMLQVSAPVQPGNSGGPLVDSSGNVIGVIVAKLNAARVSAATGDIPQNVNFALKSSVARNFLESNSIAYETAPARPALPTADIGERIKKATFKIECWR